MKTNIANKLLSKNFAILAGLGISMLAITAYAESESQTNKVIPAAVNKRINEMKTVDNTKVTILASAETEKGTYTLLHSTDGNFNSEEVFFVAKGETKGKTLAGDTSFEIMATSQEIKDLPQDLIKKFSKASEYFYKNKKPLPDTELTAKPNVPIKPQPNNPPAQKPTGIEFR
jgi:hypothetical protein